MLSDFFAINLPYGIARNYNNEWIAFNREYMPLGFNDIKYKKKPGCDFDNLPVYTKYTKVSDNLLEELAEDETYIRRNDTGEIIKIFLYHNNTNPVSNNTNTNWSRYFEKLKKLSKLKIK